MNIFKTFRLCFIFIIMFSCGLYSDEESENSSHFGTHTVYHENGDTTVTHEHSGSTDNWDYKYSATFEHVTYDTTEFTTMTHAEFSCTPRDDVENSFSGNHNDQSEIPETSHDNNNHEQSSRENNGQDQQDQDDDTDYNEYLKDMEMDREYNRQVDQLNKNSVDDHNPSHRTVSLTSSYDSDTQRSMVYQVCKSIKESLLGKNQKTLDRERIQKIAHEQEVARKKAQQEFAEEQRLQRRQELTSDLEQAYEQHQKALSCSNNQEFLKIMHGRNDPFEESLQHQKPKLHYNKLTPSTIGFLQAHNIDPRNFLQLSGVAIQHHLTQELIENITIFATLADVHFSNSKIFPLIQSGVLVSGMAQDYNQAQKICDAMSATNCSHGFLNYVQGMVDSGITCCAKFATALSFFNCEVVRYVCAVARGVAHGIVASEVSGIILSGLNMLAPELTSAVYAGATSVLVPIAVAVGFLCSAALTTELARCGYLYSIDEYEILEQELVQIKNFAQQFYNFDQASVQHVENLATLTTTLIWPSQRQAIFEYLMDMQKVTCNVWLDTKNFVSQTRIATQNQLHNAFESIKNNELAQFKIIHKKIFDEHIFDLFPLHNPGLVLAGMQNLINPSDQNQLVQLLIAQESSTGGNAIRFGLSQVSFQSIHKCSPDAIAAINSMIETTLVSQDAIEMFESLKPYLISDRLVEGLAEIKGVRQIDDFRVITKNFTDIYQLAPYEVVYLNACNWFYPQFIEINELIKKEQLSIIVDGQTIEIDSFGLFHSLLGDMRPGKLETAKRGGHLFLPDLKLQTHALDNFQDLGDGFFSLYVKHIQDGGSADLKTFFPFGKTPLECVDIIIDAIKNPQKIRAVDLSIHNKVIEITNEKNQIFKICIRNRSATFFRMKE